MLGVQAVTALTIGGSVTFGMALALLGHLKLELSRRPEQATGKVDLLLWLLNLALIPMIILAGVLVDFWGARPTIVVGSIMLALSFLALSAGPAYRRSIVAVTVAAFAAAAVGTASIVLMPRGLFGRHEATASLQVGMVFVALGALLMPPLIDLLLRGVGFGRSMAIVALLMLAPAFLVAALPMGDLGASGDAANVLTMLQKPGVWVAGAVFFCYAPLEAFVSVWTTTMLGGRGVSSRNQLGWLTGFWIAFLTSRLAIGFVEHAGYLHDEWCGWLLFGFTLFSAVVIGNLAGAFRMHQTTMGLVLLGFFMGPLFPFLAGMLFRLNRDTGVPGTAFGLLYACGSIGCLVLSPLVSLSAGARTIQMALRIPFFLAMVLAAATLVFVLIR